MNKNRSTFIGSSESAALFDASPHTTAYELWHRKAGNLPEPDLSDNERVFWGTTLEPAIAAGVAAKTGWHVRKVRRHCPHAIVEGMASSPDFEIVANDRGPGILEIKTVDWLVYRDWADGEPPLHYEIQLQHQLACVRRGWGAFGVLVGGNDLKIVEYEARPKTIALIEERVGAFWQSIKEGQPPEPNFERDSDAIRALYRDATDDLLDARGDRYLASLCASYADLSASQKSVERQRDAIKAEILTRIESAAKVLLDDGYSISAGTVAGTPDRIISADMVGQSIKGRSSYRALRINQRKQQQKEAA